MSYYDIVGAMRKRDFIEENIRLVRSTYERGLAAAAGTDAKKGILSLGKVIDEWEKRGRQYRAQKAPQQALDGWVRAGEELMRGIADISKVETPGLFRILAQTVVKTATDVKTKAVETIQSVKRNKWILAAGIFGLGGLALWLVRK